MKSLRASQSTVYRSTEFEAATALWRNTSTVCTIVTVGYGVRMKRVLACSEKCGLLLFFLWSWQGRRQSKIGCYSAQRWAAFHCNTWEKIQHWRQNNRAVRVWEFLVMEWPGLPAINLPRTKIHLSQPAWSVIEWSSSSEESCVLACPLLFILKESSRQRPRSGMSWKTPGEVRARTCGTKSPSRSEALRFIDSSKSPTTK